MISRFKKIFKRFQLLELQVFILISSLRDGSKDGNGKWSRALSIFLIYLYNLYILYIKIDKLVGLFRIYYIY